MSKRIKVLSVGTEVVVVKDSVYHCIPKGTVSVITYWDGSDTAPVYKLEGRDKLVWFSDVKPTETTPKTKETKSMTTKKPGTTHGKPTAKGLRVQPKTTPKPKYPAPRVASEYTPIVTPRTTKDGLHTELGFVVHEWNKEKQEHAVTGTKLDRALVDLKEAKAKIKALEAAK